MNERGKTHNNGLQRHIINSAHFNLFTLIISQIGPVFIHVKMIETVYYQNNELMYISGFFFF